MWFVRRLVYEGDFSVAADLLLDEVRDQVMNEIERVAREAAKEVAAADSALTARKQQLSQLEERYRGLSADVETRIAEKEQLELAEERVRLACKALAQVAHEIDAALPSGHFLQIGEGDKKDLLSKAAETAQYTSRAVANAKSLLDVDRARHGLDAKRE